MVVKDITWTDDIQEDVFMQKYNISFQEARSVLSVIHKVLCVNDNFVDGGI